MHVITNERITVVDRNLAEHRYVGLTLQWADYIFSIQRSVRDALPMMRICSAHDYVIMSLYYTLDESII